MTPDKAPDLFEIRLSEEGLRFARKLVRIVKFVVLAAILISAISIISAVYYFSNAVFDYSSLSFLQELYISIFPFCQVIHALMFLAQIYFYRKFSRELSFAVEYNNEMSFNQSFRSLYQNAVWAIITMSFTFIFSLLDLAYVVSFRY